MPLTSRGLRVITDWVDGASTPSNLALILTTDIPVWSTKLESALTEVANGNGYTTGGQTVSLNTTDWPVETESDTAGLEYLERQMKAFSWTASGGNIPASGDGPKAIVLIDDVATANVIGWLDLVTARTIISGTSLTASNFTLRIGGNVAGTPEQSEASGEQLVTCGIGSKGSYSTALFASTAFVANYCIFQIRSVPTAHPYDFDIATGAASSEVIIVPDFRVSAMGQENRMIDLLVPFPFLIPAGTRISVRGQGTGQVATVEVHMQLFGP